MPDVKIKEMVSIRGLEQVNMKLQPCGQDSSSSNGNSFIDKRNWMQFSLDKMSIGLSMICTIHCITIPLMVIIFPSILVFVQLDHHSIHETLAWIAVPTSAVAAYLGYQNHKDQLVPFLTAIGAISLLATAFFGHDAFGEVGEKFATLFAGSILAYAHWRNYSASLDGSIPKHADAAIKVALKN